MKPSLLVLLCGALSAAPTLQLLHKPVMNKTTIVFTYAGDLWSVPREGGVAVRLTTGNGNETEAAMSPDGAALAFTGEYDGNIDVFTMPVTGGVPKRITYHPDADRVVGWTPDGSRILFRSNRESFSRFTQLYTVAPSGGLPTVLPLPMACTGAYSPDGTHMVYAPLDGGQFAPGFNNFVAWKRYRGGEASYLWLVNLNDLTTVKVPRKDSNDIDPMWIGDKVYFLSDRNGPMTLYRWDPKSKAEPVELIPNKGKDIDAASAGPGGIIYEQFGRIMIYDLASNKSHEVPIDVAADLSEVRPHFQNVSREIRTAKISPTGVRAVLEAHGEIVTAPAEKGDIRNLTRTPGVMERTPAWSPDGKTIAYFSDESGEYALHIKSQSGEGEIKKIPLAGNSAYYFDPKWSPDSKHIAFTDNELNLWDLEIAGAKLTKVDTDYAYEIGRDFAWSADSKWITFVRLLPNRFHAVFVYSLDSGKSTQITGDLSDARHPVFDRDGQYLYLTASTNFGPTISGLDMTSDEHDVTRSIYMVVLPNNIASPLAPESDEEKAGAAPRKAAAEDAAGVVEQMRRRRRPSRSASISIESSSASFPFRCPRARIRCSPPDTRESCTSWSQAQVAEEAAAARTAERRFPSSTSKHARPRNWPTTSRRSTSLPTAKKCCSVWAALERADEVDAEERRPLPVRSTSSFPPMRRSNPAKARCASTILRSMSIRTPNGSRCITKSGASSAAISTIRISTASTLRTRRRSTKSTSMRWIRATT